MMTERELLWRKGRYLQVDDLGVGGGDSGDENDNDDLEEGGEEEQSQAPTAITLTQEELDAKIAEAVRVQGEEALARQRREMAERAQQQQYQPAPTDPGAIRKAKLKAIAEEFDEERKAEMLLELAEESVAARMAPQLAYSSEQGAINTVLALEPDMPEQARGYVGQAVRELGITPEQANNPANAKAIRRIAIGMAHENKAFETPAPAAARTVAPKPAPAGAAPVKGGLAAKLTPAQKAVLDAEVAMIANEPSMAGKSYDEIASMFSRRDLEEMFASANMAGAMK